MPRTIEEGFRDFHDNLKLIKTETDAVKRHRASIEACMKSNFGMNRFFRTGSIGNGTNVNRYSDTDYFAGIPRENLKNNSALTLKIVKEALQSRFPSTSIFVSSPAVVIEFGRAKSETTEIIPADYLRTKNGVNIYDIPDGSRSWMKSSPKANNDYVTIINSNLSCKVKPLIRFIKAWKFYNNVPISSFYLEMRVAKYVAQEKTIIYSIDIKNVLAHLISIKLTRMIDPTGVGGYIQACKSETSRQDAMSKLITAYTRTKKARDAESNDNISDAFYWWNRLFNDKFPTYYY